MTQPFVPPFFAGDVRIPCSSAAAPSYPRCLQPTFLSPRATTKIRRNATFCFTSSVNVYKEMVKWLTRKGRSHRQGTLHPPKPPIPQHLFAVVTLCLLAKSPSLCSAPNNKHNQNPLDKIFAFCRYPLNNLEIFTCALCCLCAGRCPEVHCAALALSGSCSETHFRPRRGTRSAIALGASFGEAIGLASSLHINP
eukprot:TRINITY_DN504_c0_g1_i1.p1 TRINITY_DN504_c0_g1~~TRINITY_DN504_c0_g1_i1.p1  ORF type:complete len:195 (+),score=7.89 TRINITY_DN504_c0_g1_i1:348-932(+)